jgi:tripeptide aminopeptidase
MHAIDEEAAIGRVMELMAIPGKSCEEEQIASEVITRLQAAGIPRDDFVFDDAHTRTPRKGEVGNLLVRIPGTRPGPLVLLSAHLDTVPICVGSRPKRTGDHVESSDPATGLGADNRAGVAALITAVTELLQGDVPHGPLVLCFFVQEEIGLQGSRCLDREVLGPVDLALNFDGDSAETLIVGATGGERIEIEIRGHAAHAGLAPEQGVNASTIFALAAARLHQDGWLGRVRIALGEGTSNVGVVRGGEATNVVMPALSVKCEARSHQSDVRTRIVEEIRQVFEWAAGQVESTQGLRGTIDFSSNVDYESFRLDDAAPSVASVEAAVRAVGRTPRKVVAGGGLDANWLYQHGIQAVTLGCGQRNVHTVSEQLDLRDYLDACRVAIELAAAGAEA